MYANRYGSPSVDSNQTSFVAELSDDELAAFAAEVKNITSEMDMLLPDPYVVASEITAEGPANHQAMLYGETIRGLPFQIVIPVTLERLEHFNQTNETFFLDKSTADIAQQLAAQMISADLELDTDINQVAQ